MTQTPAFYFDILENLARGRCPACELVRQKPMHYIDHALYGLVTDPGAQNLFAETGGYCRRHAGMLLKIPWGSALGVAILYKRLVEDAAAQLQAGRGEEAGRTKRGGISGNLFSRKGRKDFPARDDNPDCLACKVERETEQGVMNTLVEVLRAGDGRMVAAVEGNEGFCLYHLGLARTMEHGGRIDPILRRHGLRRAERLLAELSEFIRKSDYRFTREQMGGEGDSWMRAVGWVTGVSLEKEDRAFSPGELKRKMRGETPAEE
ncbi:MAG: hypothetical protein JW748_05150 [Anaerolineales bacterium]|nr:hypothetical protein [Anaerolineales bacterium]